MSRRHYSGACLSCGGPTLPGAKRCGTCYREFRAVRLAAGIRPEPERPSWPYCNGCGATGPEHPLQHAATCTLETAA